MARETTETRPRLLSYLPTSLIRSSLRFGFRTPIPASLHVNKSGGDGWQVAAGVDFSILLSGERSSSECILRFVRVYISLHHDRQRRGIFYGCKRLRSDRAGHQCRHPAICSVSFLDSVGDVWVLCRQLSYGKWPQCSVWAPNRSNCCWRLSCRRGGRSRPRFHLGMSTPIDIYTSIALALLICIQGWGKDGQTGLGDAVINNPTPRQVQGLLGVRIVEVQCGGGHTGALDGTLQFCGLFQAAYFYDGNFVCLDAASGALYLWGRGRDGQLGRGDGVESTVSALTAPKRVDSLLSRNIEVLWFYCIEQPDSFVVFRRCLPSCTATYVQVQQVALGGDHSIVIGAARL